MRRGSAWGWDEMKYFIVIWSDERLMLLVETAVEKPHSGNEKNLFVHSCKKLPAT